MTRRHFVLLIAYCMLVSLAAAGASLAVCMVTDRWAFMVIAMAAITVAGFYFISRWWLGIARSIGIPSTIAWTPPRATIALVAVATMAGSVALGYVAYAVTSNRFVEGVISIGVSFPVLFVVQRFGDALSPRPKPQEAAMLRFSFYLQLILPVVFCLTLVTDLLPTQHYDGIGLRDWIIPAYFMLIAVFPMNAFFIRKRYLQARADTVGASARV